MKADVQNPDISGEERTYLTADYSSGTSLTVANNNGATTNYYVVVGEPGQEQTETQRITGTSGNETITIASALVFDHTKSTPVYITQFNQWSFERKPTGGSFTEIGISPLDIDWDNENKATRVVVSGGLTTDTYRWRPYSEITGTYGTYSDELVGTGLARTKVGYLIQQVQKNPIAKNISDETIIDYFNDFQDHVYINIPTAWWFTKKGTAVATAVDTYKYSVSTNWSDLLSIKFMLYRYVNGDTDITYPLTWSPDVEFYNLKMDANQASDDYAKYWNQLAPDSSSAKGYIGLHPTPKTDDCYLIPVYLFELTRLDSFGDTIVIPYPKGYIDYAWYRIYDDLKSDKTNADKYLARVNGAVKALRKKAKRQFGQPLLMRFKGHRGFARLFGEQGRLSSPDSRELFW